MTVRIDINEISALSGKRYAIAWLDEPLDDCGKVALVGLWPIMALCMSVCPIDPANMGNRPFIGLDLTGARVTLADLFAEEVRKLPLIRPSGRTEPTSLLAMVSIQTRAMLGREERLDDDSEWYDTQSRIIRSMTPDRAKIWSAEIGLIYMGNLGNHRIPMEDEEVYLEIVGLEPNQWTGTFVENLIPPKAKWYRW